MKKRTLVLILILAALLTGGIGFTVGYAVTQKQCEEQPNYYANKLTSPPLPNKVNFAGEVVPMDIYWVREALDRELVVNCYQHSKTIRIMKLSARVFPVVERILKEEGVPDDLKYLYGLDGKSLWFGDIQRCGRTLPSGKGHPCGLQVS